MTGVVAVQLGRLGPSARLCTVDDVRGRLFYLADLHAIVAVEHRNHEGWRCGVIAGHYRHPGPRHFTLTDAQIAAAPTTITIDPVADPDGYAMLWQTRVRQCSRGGHTQVASRLLVEYLRPPHTLTVDLDPPAVLRLAQATRLRPPGLHRLMDRLSDDGLLTPTTPDRYRGWGVYTLTIPAALLHTSRTAAALTRADTPPAPFWPQTSNL